MKRSAPAAPDAASGALDRLGDFDEIIDVRSPAEFALDHIPGATSAPVLSNVERARIGTLHAADSAFAAKRAGAALVAANLARHLETLFSDRPRSWRPLVYCWRGGQRSGAMTEVFRRIGWRAEQLEGGYRAYRRRVVADLDQLPSGMIFHIVCGVTGSGKSRLLRALRRTGAQVLDLEELACHRGSVLGELPGQAQPSQKMFDSLVRSQLLAFDATRPVFVEAESKKIGVLQVPDALMTAMRASPCLRVDLGIEQRVALLKEEYAHFLGDSEALGAQLDCLTLLHGHARVAQWKALGQAHAWDDLVATLLAEHYDPAYLRGMARNYAGFGTAPVLPVAAADNAAFDAAARECLTLLGGDRATNLR
ncbi:MAG: tRNA 2-selenouridine(34) synthase MnmH [Burkholderiales bacterium]|nr:tRNA 2-selenouridine(34) synthase MnmH [Burkholderiales bacterium]